VDGYAHGQLVFTVGPLRMALQTEDTGVSSSAPPFIGLNQGSPSIGATLTLITGIISPDVISGLSTHFPTDVVKSYTQKGGRFLGRSSCVCLIEAAVQAERFYPDTKV